MIKPMADIVRDNTKRIDIVKALRQKMQGRSYREIAKLQGIHHTAVHQAIAPILAKLPSSELLEEYKANSADVFQNVAMRTLLSINEGDLEKANLRDKVIAAGIATDKARLISGQSTSNSHVIIGAIQAACEDD